MVRDEPPALWVDQRLRDGRLLEHQPVTALGLVTRGKVATLEHDAADRRFVEHVRDRRLDRPPASVAAGEMDLDRLPVRGVRDDLAERRGRCARLVRVHEVADHPSAQILRAHLEHGRRSGVDVLQRTGVVGHQNQGRAAFHDRAQERDGSRGTGPGTGVVNIVPPHRARWRSASAQTFIGTRRACSIPAADQADDGPDDLPVLPGGGVAGPAEHEARCAGHRGSLSQVWGGEGRGAASAGAAVR